MATHASDVFMKAPQISPRLRRKGLARWIAACCVIVAPLLAGKLQAQDVDFDYTSANGAITVTNYIGPAGNATIPASIDGMPVTGIGGHTFWGRTNLTAVTIPDSVTNIEDGFVSKGGGLGAFAMCDALTNVTWGNGVRYIGIGTFTECTNLTRVNIPDSVAIVGDFAFHYCKGLTNVKIGKSVTSLGPGIGYAFNGCGNLDNVVVPGSVTNLGAHAFDSCVSLASVTIENGLTRIGDHAFYFCQSLTNITLPESVRSIEAGAFAYCSNLAGVYFKGNAPALPPPGDVFYFSSNVTVYYLPGTTGWGPTFSGRPTMLWNPQVQTTDGTLGVRQNQFGFNIAGTPGIPLVIDASADPVREPWASVQNCTLTNGLIHFSDPQWTNNAARFYRIRSP